MEKILQQRARSEWVADGEMEGEVASKVWFEDCPAGTHRECGVVGLHATVHTNEQEVEIESYSQAIGYGQLLVEIAPLKEAARLFAILSDGPDVAGIYEPG